MAMESHRAHPANPPFSRILVGFSGSGPAEEAVRQGARLASLTGATLEIVHVGPPGGRERDPDVLLQEAVVVAQAEGARAERRLLAGALPEVLVHEAEEHWSDLICVGTGRSLGSVARHTVQRAPCSVLVALHPHSRSFPRRIVCAVDGSEPSLEAARQAAALAALGDGSLRLLHVLGTSSRRVTVADAERSLEAAAELTHDWGIRPLREMTFGVPGEAILDIASGQDTDLIVLGSRGLHGVRRLLLGSVGEHVARWAGCSVLIARPRPR